MVSRKIAQEKKERVINRSYYGSYDIPPRRGLLSPQEQERNDKLELARYVTHHYHGGQITIDPLDRESLSV